jgi:hypothetical protein
MYERASFTLSRGWRALMLRAFLRLFPAAA